MNIAIILSGGIGSRVGASVPKQYVLVGKRPIISYCYDTFLASKLIHGIIIVAATEWQSFLIEKMELKKDKFLGFALPGDTRQESVLNGLERASQFLKTDEDIVIIHDAARPNLRKELLELMVEKNRFYDGVLPVLPSKDTLYYSNDGSMISALLEREKIFAGQSPESFVFAKYYAINKEASRDELSATRGSSEIAFKHNLSICIIPGDESNYKITTKHDLSKFINENGGLSGC